MTFNNKGNLIWQLFDLFIPYPLQLIEVYDTTFTTQHVDSLQWIFVKEYKYGQRCRPMQWPSLEPNSNHHVLIELSITWTVNGTNTHTYWLNFFCLDMLKFWLLSYYSWWQKFFLPKKKSSNQKYMRSSIKSTCALNA